MSFNKLLRTTAFSVSLRTAIQRAKVHEKVSSLTVAGLSRGLKGIERDCCEAFPAAVAVGKGDHNKEVEGFTNGLTITREALYGPVYALANIRGEKNPIVCLFCH